MNIPILVTLLIASASCLFAAAPSIYVPWTALRGAGGLTVSSNPAAGTATFNGSGLTGPFTNSNGTVSNSVASTVSNGVFSSSVNLSAAMPLWSLKNNGTNVWQVSSDGGVSAGLDTVSYWGSLPTNGFAWRYAKNADLRGNDLAQWSLLMFGAGGNAESSLAHAMDTNGIQSVWDSFDANSESFVKIGATPTTAYMEQNISGTVRVLVSPGIADGSTPYVLDTSIAHTSGNLLEVKNNGTIKVAVDYDGGISGATITTTIPGSAIVGITNGAMAAAGVVGESSTNGFGTVNVKANATEYAIISNAVTKGDWEFRGGFYFSQNGATFTGTSMGAWVTTASGAVTDLSDEIPGVNDVWITSAAVNSAQTFYTPTVRFNVATNFLVYLKVYIGNYTAGTPQFIGGHLEGRRIR